MVLSMSVSKQCETLGGGREENRFRSLGSSLMGSLQSLSCVMVVTKQFPLTGEMTCPSLPSASSESTLCSQPVHSHPHTPFFHVGSLRAAKQRDFSNFMYCECHSYKQDENRSQPLSPLSKPTLPVPVQFHVLYLCKQGPRSPFSLVHPARDLVNHPQQEHSPLCQSPAGVKDSSGKGWASLEIMTLTSAMRLAVTGF